MATLTEAQIERESVEYVFRLTGGELSDKPLACTDDDEGEHVYTYHYAGVPEYASSDYDDIHSNDCDYFTIVTCCLYGAPPAVLIDGDGKRYDKVTDFVSSGETKCCCADLDEEQEDPFKGERCPYCGRDPGEEHGFIYIGDGWCEVVYRHDAIQAMRDLASSHNLQVWSDSAITFECNGTCNDDLTFPLTVVNAQPDGGCPVCGEAFNGGTIKADRWWWQTCSPGCLPDSDVMGPFDDETDALEDATEGLAD